MRSAVPLTMILVGMTLAGCISDNDVAPATDSLLDPSLREAISEPVFEILGHFEHKFVGTAGEQLYVDYYLPDLASAETTNTWPGKDEGKVPVVLVFTPYQGAEFEDLVFNPEPYIPSNPVTGSPSDAPEATAYWASLVRDLVPRGYAVAFADVRGNHQAGGCIDQTGPEQWQDGYDYVELLGTEEWSNGNVGMYGVSYDAETQFTTAMMAPPHLKTIVPIASVSNQYEWNFYQGVPYEGQPFFGMFGYGLGSASPSYKAEDAVHYPEKLTCQPEQFIVGTDFSGDMTEFWQTRDYRPMAAQIEASVFHIHGLADWNVRPIHIDPLFNDIQSEKRGMFGLWHHTLPDRADYNDLLIAWYDHYLMEKQTGILDILPPVLIEDSQNEWHGIDSFPPVTQDWLELELSSDGTLVMPGNATADDLEVVDYPQGRVLGFATIPQGTSPETILRTTSMFDAPRELVFEFVTEEELRLVGRPEVLFTATTDEKSTHWTARLAVVGDDRCEYTKVFDHEANETRDYGQSVCYNTGYQDTRHLNGPDQPEDITPGEPYEVQLRMYPQYDVIPAGSTVQLILSNKDGEVDQDNTFARNILHLGPETPALFRLPLSPASHPLPHDELPAIYPGYLEA